MKIYFGNCSINKRGPQESKVILISFDLKADKEQRCKEEEEREQERRKHFLLIIDFYIEISMTDVTVYCDHAFGK